MGEGSFKICLIYSLQRCYIGITHLNLSGDFSPDKHWLKVIEDGVYMGDIIDSQKEDTTTASLIGIMNNSGRN